MPRRPNKTDYGMLDAPADIDRFFRKQSNDEVDEFEKKAEKRYREIPATLRFFMSVMGVTKMDFFRIYEMGWNDGHSNGHQQGKQEVWFYNGRENNATSSGIDNQGIVEEEGKPVV